MVGVLEEKEYKEINCCKSCVEFEQCGYCKFFNTFIDAQDEACSYYEERVKEKICEKYEAYKTNQQDKGYDGFV